MIDRYDHRGRLLDEPDDIDEPPDCHCGAALPLQPQESRRLVGYPDEQPFIEVLVWRRCPPCGAEHSEQGYYEEGTMGATPLRSADVLCPHCGKRLDRFLTQVVREEIAYCRLELIGCGHCHALIHVIELPMALGALTPAARRLGRGETGEDE